MGVGVGTGVDVGFLLKEEGFRWDGKNVWSRAVALSGSCAAAVRGIRCYHDSRTISASFMSAGLFNMFVPVRSLGIYS